MKHKIGLSFYINLIALTNHTFEVIERNRNRKENTKKIKQI
jgi:hypothetical protein